MQNSRSYIVTRGGGDRSHGRQEQMFEPGSAGTTTREANSVAVPLRSNIPAILVPLALLLSKKLTPAAKFLWIRLRLEEHRRRRRSHATRKLAKRTGLARSTVILALRQASDEGWLVPEVGPGGRKRWKTACPVQGGSGFVKIPVDLIRDSETMRPQEIVCYGILQAVPSFNGTTGMFKWAELRRLTGWHLKTVKRAVRALARELWIGLAQKNRLAPIRYRLQHADEARLDLVRRRLEERMFIGEAIMQEVLSLIAATDQCQERARPDFLVNPATGEKMELDRYYPLNHVAFEFNGSQHYVASGRFSKEEVSAQRKRDALKRQICKREKIKLVIIHAEDLKVNRLLKKVGDSLPKRSLRILKQTIKYLNRCAEGYYRKVSLLGQGG